MRRVVFILLLAVCVSCGSLAYSEAELHGWDHARKFEYVTFGQYPQTGDGEVMPVLWRVLHTEQGQALLLSEYVLDAQQVIFESDPKVIEERTYRKISTFEESDLFPWMNTTMLNALFTLQEQGSLVSSDRGLVFLLDRFEYLKPNYGFTASVYGAQPKRQCKPTEYAIARGVYQDRTRTVGYWTSTVRGPKGHQLQIVGYNGHLSFAGYPRKDVGLRISCLVDLGKVTIVSGTGKKDDPYVLQAVKTAQAPSED